MVDNNPKKIESETLFSKVISKKNKAGSREVGKMTIEVKKYDGSVFVQMTQDKYAFGNIPAKRTWITFNPEDKEILNALNEAVDSFENQ